MKEVKIEISDQVNCRIIGLDPAIKRKLRQENRYFLQWARHTPHYKAGFWDGYEYLIDQGGRTFINQLENILPTLINAGYEIDLQDNRSPVSLSFPIVDENMFGDKVWPKNHKFEGEPIKLMDHQAEALKQFFKNPQGVQVLPTSAGKTLITAAMSYCCEKYGNTLVIVPNKSLVEQTEKDFINLGLDVGVYYGDRKDIGKTHTICTWQSLSILAKKTKKDDGTALLNIMQDCFAVICDEVHGAKAKELKNVLSGPLSHCPVRWGLTGTMPKDDYDIRVINNVIGSVMAEIKPKELQDKGILSQCDIDIVQLVDDFEFTTYHTEQKYLVEDIERLEWIGQFVIEQSVTGNTLVLVNKVNTGKELLRIIEGLGKEAVFINGSVRTDKRQEQYDEVHDSNDKIIIATYGVAAVGINIPRIFNLVLLEPGKSFVRVIQSIGRGLRVAKDKDFVKIFDIASTCKFSKRHLRERKKYYSEKEYPFTLRKVKWR